MSKTTRQEYENEKFINVIKNIMFYIWPFAKIKIGLLLNLQNYSLNKCRENDKKYYYLKYFTLSCSLKTIILQTKLAGCLEITKVAIFVV